MTTPPRKPLRAAPILTRYVIGWTTFAAFGVGYLAIALVSPETLEDLTPAIAITTSHDNPRQLTRLSEDVAALREGMSQVQIDVTQIKTELSGQSDHTKTIASKVDALEDRIKSHEAPVQANAAPPSASQSAAAAPARPAAADADTVQQPSEAAPPKAKIINAAKPAEPAGNLVTGSVKSDAAADISFGPAVVKPAPKPLGLKLSSGQSVDSLRLSWSLLSDHQSDVLANLEPRYMTSGDADNPNYDLIAGPVKTKAEAIRLCKALAAKNVACKVSEFGGNAL